MKNRTGFYAMVALLALTALLLVAINATQGTSCPAGYEERWVEGLDGTPLMQCYDDKDRLAP